MPPHQAPATLALIALVCVQGCSHGPSSAQEGVDSGTPDVSPTDSGAIDTGADGDAGLPVDATADGPLRDAGSWCATQGLHLFCDDFDHGPAAQYWDQVQQQHGTPRLDGTTYTSPYQSLLASTTVLAQGAVAAVGLSKRVTYLASQMHLAYDLRVDALDPSGAPVVVSALQMLDTATDILETVSVLVAPSGATVDDFATLDGGVAWDHTHALVAASALAQWTRIQIDIVLPGYDGGPEPGTLTVFVGGQKTPAIDHAALSPVAALAQPFFYIGVVTATGPSLAISARFDDVTFDVQP
jgi:hypothetical protein